MADQPPKKPIPPPVLAAQRALRRLAARKAGVPEGLEKKLPAFAMQLDRAGEKVTVELLLKRVRAGELGKEPALKPEQKTYAEIVAGFPAVAEEENPFTQESFENIAIPDSKAAEVIMYIAMTCGSLDAVKYLAEKRGLDVHHPAEMALPKLVHEGHLNIIKYLAEEHGVDIYADPLAFHTAAYCGHLDIVKYFVEKQAAERPVDIHADTLSFHTAVNDGHFDIVKYFEEKQTAESCVDIRQGVGMAATSGFLGIVRYFVEEQDADSSWAFMPAVTHGQIDVVKYLVEERGMDIRAFGTGKLQAAAENAHFNVVKYCCEQGADPSGLGEMEKFRLMDYITVCDTWQKVAHMDPPQKLDKEDVAYFKPKVFEAVSGMLKEEFYPAPDIRNPIAFYAAGLFGTEARVLQYLEKWGKAGKQPLHDIIQMISLPEKKTPEMNLKAWGDAVLKCGPSMAKLVKFADKLPVPEKSDDGKTWSMVNTRAKVAKFAYEKAAENPALALLCIEHSVSEKSFNEALELSKNPPKVKNIPDIALDGAAFDMPGAKFHRLAADDIRGLFLGEMTDCCQSIGGAGAACARQGFISEDGGFYAVENAKGKVVGQTWAWRGEKGELVFDSLETLGQNVKANQWLKLTEAFGEALADNPCNVTALHVGAGGATPKSLTLRFNTAASPAKPAGYDGYRDSNQQVVVWQKRNASNKLTSP